jgi:hypothetical protein
MTSIIAKYISKKVLGETMQNNFGKEVIQKTYLQSLMAKLTLGLGPILRDRSCDPFRWQAIQQEREEEAQGITSRHF